jgi:hypothetical protein
MWSMLPPNACSRPSHALLAQHLAAELDRVAAAAGVEEVGHRAGRLVALAIELPALVRALDDLQTCVCQKKSSLLLAMSGK